MGHRPSYYCYNTSNSARVGPLQNFFHVGDLQHLLPSHSTLHLAIEIPEEYLFPGFFQTRAASQKEDGRAPTSNGKHD